MGRHFRFPPALLLAAAAAALVAACGSGAQLAGDSPSQAVAAALEAAQTTPLVMSFEASLSLDTAGLKNVPASLQPTITNLGEGGAASGRLLQASSQRRQVSLTAGGHTYTFVAYDGHGYLRRDGAGFAELAKALPATPMLSSATITAAVGALDFQDRGTALVSGQTTEHYHAAPTATSIAGLVEALGGSGTSSSQLQQLIPMLTPFVTVRGAAVDVWVSRATGGLARASLGGSFRVDFSSIASAFAGFASPGAAGLSLPSGALSATLSLDARVTQYGGSVTLTRPVATATLPAESGPSGAWSGGLSAVLG